MGGVGLGEGPSSTILWSSHSVKQDLDESPKYQTRSSGCVLQRKAALLFTVISWEHATRGRCLKLSYRVN